MFNIIYIHVGGVEVVIIRWLDSLLFFFTHQSSLLKADLLYKKLIFTMLYNKMNCELMLTYDTPALRQTGSRNLTGQKTLPTIWGTYMKLVTKYQISAINSC